MSRLLAGAKPQRDETCESCEYQINLDAAAETHEKTGEAGDAWLKHDADAGRQRSRPDKPPRQT